LDLRFGAEHEAFRVEAREWLTDRLAGPFAAVRGRGGPGDEDACVEERREWELELGAGRWIGLSWPKEYGGREASLLEQVIFYEEYARAGGPGRVGIVGEGLLGPTIVHFGSDEQKRRFLPGILAGRDIWCQGYSEPNAGSDLANVSTRAERDGDEWVVTGQKVWTSLAHWAQWCFVLCRTNRDAPRHRGLSYLLVPMDQPGIEIRPIRQITGTSEFNEVFFTEARTPIDNVVGAVDDGWSVAMSTLSFERGTGFMRDQVQVSKRVDELIDLARERTDRRGRALIADGEIAARLANARAEADALRAMTLADISRNARRDQPGAESSMVRLFHSELWQRVCRLAVDVLGLDGVAEAGQESLPGQYLYSYAGTIAAGSKDIQRNIIGERLLGLPRGR
jgi:alkylation response protein AidB-like acyl-CoA dehydrogenase